jgi:hypothetical protein
LRGFLFERGFEIGKVDQTLFLLRQGKDILIVQVYVDDIVFGGSSNSMVARFVEDISREFEMSKRLSTRVSTKLIKPVGMDSDVWKSELSVFVSAKNANMDIRIRIRF